MGNSVAGATGVRSLSIVGAVSGSSPFAGKRRGGLADERRAAALDVNVDRMLIGASLRASKRLRAKRHGFPRNTWLARPHGTKLSF